MSGELEPSWVREDPKKESSAEQLAPTTPSWATPNLKTPMNNERKTPIKSVLKYKHPQVLSLEKESAQSYDLLLIWLRVLHIISMVLCIIMIAMNVFLLVKRVLLWNEYVIRIYSILFCCLMFLIEIDLQCVVHQWKALHSWIYRGLFYGFLGILTWKEDSSTIIPDIVGIAVLVLGLVHIILGLLGMEEWEGSRRQARSQYQEIPNDFMKSPDKV